MSSPATSGQKPTGATGRMAAVKEMGQLLRMLFEVEREFVRTVTVLIPRVGDIELKYLLCQHVWESMGHARFIRERGRELTGFGKDDAVRESYRSIFEEAIRAKDPLAGLAGFYKVLKPALLDAYRHYLESTHHLADWPSRKLVEEFIVDEERHLREMEPFLPQSSERDWEQHLTIALDGLGGWLGEREQKGLPKGFEWNWKELPYRHPGTCSRGEYPVCSSVFGHDPESDPIVREWLEDPNTDARVVRLMVFIWLMMELDAVDYLSPIFYDTTDAPFDLHYDLARHLWDESRHSAFGYRQLPKLKVDLSKLEHSLDLYNILIQMSPPERYAMMTMEFEAGSFATKAQVMDRVRELNDFEADTLLAFDRNDEQQHVRFGHRWLPEIMRLFGEEGSVEVFVESSRERFKELEKEFGGKTPHSLSPEDRLTGNKLRAIAELAQHSRSNWNTGTSMSQQSSSEETNAPIWGRYGDLRPAAIEAILERTPVAFVPWGALEWHCLHAPVGLDSTKAEGICLAIAEKTGGVVLPAIPLGVNTIKPFKGFAHSIDISADLASKVAEEICIQLADEKFEIVILMTGHYPPEQIDALEEGASRARNVATQTCFEVWADNQLLGDHFVGDHAGATETSFQMLFSPDTIDLSALPDRKLSLDGDGVMGDDPREASRERGQRQLEIVLQAAIPKVNALLSERKGLK